MSFLDLIPAQYRLAVEAALLAAALLAAGACGWHVKAWKDGATIADLKTQHAQAIADANTRTLAAQRKADADHEALTAQLAADSAAYHEDLTRREHAIDLLRPAVAAGTRVVRVAGTCPRSPAGVPQAAAGGRVDPGAGAVLAADAGQRVLDLRAGAERFDVKLRACQQALIRMTGQRAPAATTP